MNWQIKIEDKKSNNTDFLINYNTSVKVAFIVFNESNISNKISNTTQKPKIIFEQPLEF